MTKQAYMRGLTKKAANTDFFTSYDDRWSRAGLAGLATLLGSKALGAGWGTAGTLAALAGTGAYNTHNYDAIKNRLTQWLGLGKKEQTPAPNPEAEKLFQRELERTSPLLAARADVDADAKQKRRAAKQKAMAEWWRKRQLARQFEQALGQDLTDNTSSLELLQRAADAQDAAKARNEKQQRWTALQSINAKLTEDIAASASPEQRVQAVRRAYYAARQLGYYNDAVNKLQPLVDKYNSDNNDAHNVHTLAGFDSDYANKYNQASKQDYNAFVSELKAARNSNFQIPRDMLDPYGLYLTVPQPTPRAYSNIRDLWRDITRRSQNIR